jgi:Tfp pilus assembly protein PilF
LEKLVQLDPNSPEFWYELAGSHAMFGQNPAALDSLKKALDLNSKRLAQDTKSKDIRTTLASDPRFAKLRDTPEFKALGTSH